MKKHIITFLICSVMAGVSAQNYTQAFDSVFQHVDLSHTSTGILYERVLPFETIDETVNNKVKQTDSLEYYKYGLGLSLNVLGSAYTIKYGISKYCVFQTDLGIKYFINFVKDEGVTSPVMLILVEAAQNFLYQRKLAEKGGKSCYFLVGAGFSGGMTPYGPVTWKIGATPLIGMEFVLKKPKLSFQIDIRPGYAALFRTEEAQQAEEHPFITGFTSGIKQYPYHGYDISLNFAIRFCKITNE